MAGIIKFALALAPILEHCYAHLRKEDALLKTNVKNTRLSTSMGEAIEYLSKLEADRTAALAVSEEKIREAALIKARMDGFREAMEIFGLNFNPDGVEIKERKPGRGQRRNIPQMILHELSFSGKAMTKEQIAMAIGYIPERTEAVLNRLERAGQITKNLDGRWEAAVIAVPRPNGHAAAA